MARSQNAYDRIPLGLVVLLIACVAAGLVATSVLPHHGGPQRSRLPDLSSAHLVEIRDASGRTVLTGEFRDRTDSGGNVHKDAALVDRRGRRVIGEVEVDLPGPQAMHQPQKLDIDIIGIGPGAKFSLFIDDHEVTTFITDDRGHVDAQITNDEPPPSIGNSSPRP